MAYIVSSGDLESGIILENDTMTVLDGGIATETTVNYQGWLYVSNGGTANSTTVNGGSMSVNGTANSTTVNSRGEMYVSSGGIATDTMVNDENRLYVFSGGTANSTTVSGGSMDVDGTANSTMVNGGRFIVRNGGVASCITVHGGGYGNSFLHVSRGGTTNSTTINSGGRLNVSSGGMATEIIENGGYVSVEEGANVTFVSNTFSSLILSSKDSATVHSGTTANSTTINSGCKMDVYSGGTANNNTVNYKGWLYVSNGGVANETSVNSGGKLYVASGGTAMTIIENGGHVEVAKGANVTFVSNSFSGLVLSNAAATLHSGTTANSTTVNSRGRLNVSSGGTANSTTVNAGGSMFVSSGGTATDIIWTPCEGHVHVDDGGIATFVSQYSGVYFGSNNQLLSHETVMDTMSVGSGCEMNVMTGGTANSAMVNEWGSMYVSSGGTANSTMVNEWGYLYVSSGGVANSTTVNSGGYLSVDSGGTATNIITSSGASLGLTVASDTYIQGTLDGVAFEMKNAFISGYTVRDGSYLEVYSGGMATDTMVNFNGRLVVSSGGTAVSTAINFGGGLAIYSGGWATGTIVSCGYLGVNDSGFATDTEVYSDGQLQVNYRGRAINTIIYSEGHFDVYYGGKVAGRMQFESGAMVSMYEGAILDFDLTQMEAGEMALVNNLSIIKGAPIYTLTVDADSWKPGSYTYSLADGAQNFASTISVVNTAGDELGVLTVGETVRIGYDDYTLNLNEGALTVTVEVPDLPPTAPDGLQAIVSDQTVALLWNLSTDEDTGVKEYVVTYSLDGQEYTVRTQNTHYVLNGADYGTWSWSVKAVDFTGNESEVSVGEAFTVANFEPYIVEYSTDSFEHVLRLKVSTDALDSFRLPTGTYEWRMRTESVSDWQTGDPIVSVADSTPTFVQSDADGADDLFFANACGVWETGYLAQHGGSIGDWDGTLEYAAVFGKNKLADIFEGSDDANILLLTDDSNGDGLFVDDIYTELPGTLEEQQARIARIDEIRAGAGDDIIDMTSQRFEYIGDGILLRGGDGNDVLWANKGDNTLFGDAGNDRIVGASGDDLIAGGIGDDRMHGGGGDDIFAFCENWGADTVEQLATGSVTLWFASGELANWDADSLTYSDGGNSVTVKGVTAEQVTLKFGDDGSAQFTSLSDMGAFDAFTSRKIFEEATLA